MEARFYDIQSNIENNFCELLIYRSGRKSDELKASHSCLLEKNILFIENVSKSCVPNCPNSRNLGHFTHLAKYKMAGRSIYAS